MANTRLILRTLTSPWVTPVADITKNSVLSLDDVDNNFIYLRGELIASAGFSGGNVVITKINGSTVVVPTGAGSNTFVTGGTYDVNTSVVTLNRNDDLNVIISGLTDTVVTGFTYDNANNIILSQSNGEVDQVVLINTMSGLTVNGTLSATTVDAGDILSGGTNINTLFAPIGSSGGTITSDGNATTINGSSVDLGGTLNKNVEINGVASYGINLGKDVLNENLSAFTLNTLSSTEKYSTATYPFSGNGLSILKNSGTIAEIMQVVSNTTSKRLLGPLSSDIIIEDTATNQRYTSTVANRNIFATAENTSTNDKIRVTQTEDYYSVIASTGGLSSMEFEIDRFNAETVFTDNRTGTTAVGIQYGGDYSSNFIDESLITKRWANAAITSAVTGSISAVTIDATNILSGGTNLTDIFQPIGGVSANLATDDLVQDAESRVYNMNSQNLTFTNGYFTASRSTFGDVVNFNHSGGELFFGGASGVGTGGSNLIHDTKFNVASSTINCHRDFANTIGLCMANFTTAGGLNQYAVVQNQDGPLYLIAGGGNDLFFQSGSDNFIWLNSGGGVGMRLDSGVLSIGTWEGVTVKEQFGGTAQSTYATGDMLYASGVDTLSKLAAGSEGQVLTMNSGVPAWVNDAINDTFVTGFTYDGSNNLTITRNDLTEVTTVIDTMSGLTINGTLTATTVNADDILSGGTNLNSIFQRLADDKYTTGTTLVGQTVYFDRTDALSAYTADLSNFISTADTYTTGFTYDGANNFTIKRNKGLSDLTINVSTMTGLTVDGTVSTTTIDGGDILSGGTNINTLFQPIGGGVSDGDKGDITVAGSGAVWSIDTNAVIWDKVQDINTNRLLGRYNSGIGDVEEITIGTGLILSVGGELSITGGAPSGDTYVTGFTYDNANTLTISENEGQPDKLVNIGIMTGLTVNGILSATTLNSDIILSGGTNLTSIFKSINDLSGYWSASTGTNSVVPINQDNIASGDTSIASGDGNVAGGISSVAIGLNNEALGDNSSAFGWGNQALGEVSVAFGYLTQAIGNGSHTEGSQCIASGAASHAEGINTTASGVYSHTQGLLTTASGTVTHAGGNNSSAIGNTSFVHSHTSTVTGQRSAILGGSGNTLTIGATDSVILGGQGINGTQANTVYGVNFDASGNIFSGGTNLSTLFQPAGPVVDSNAIHNNVNAEISGIAAKASLADADIFLIEDSAASDAKKKTTLSNLKTAIGANTPGVVKSIQSYQIANTDANSNTSGTYYACKVIPTVSRDVTQMQYFVTNSSPTAVVYVGIYDNAGNLQEQGSGGATTTGLQTVTLGGTVSLVANTEYYFCITEAIGVANFASTITTPMIKIAQAAYLGTTVLPLPATLAGSSTNKSFWMSAF